MKDVKKSLIISAVISSLIIVFAVLMVLYDKGVFDISFIKRPENTTAQTVTETETDTDGDLTGEDTDDVTDGEETVVQSVFDGIHNAVPVSDGKPATELTYDKENMSLYRLTDIMLPENDAENDFMTRVRYSVFRSDVLRTFTEMQVKEARRAVDVYMGMLVISDGESLYFYDGSGKSLYKYTGEEELVFAYERDENDRPLFIIGEEYYYIDEETHELALSDFDISKSRGLNYNYPSDFGKNAVKAVYKYVYPVEQKDEGGIGSVYYDGGYTMVRRIEYERGDTNGKVVMDMEILINDSGKEFELPEGYKTVAYSDQRILVEYGGKYGFYAVKGAWIADSKYSYATPYYEGLAVVGDNLHKGVIDMDGNFVIPLSYSRISVCSGGIFVCWSSQTGYEVYIKAEK